MGFDVPLCCQNGELFISAYVQLKFLAELSFPNLNICVTYISQYTFLYSILMKICAKCRSHCNFKSSRMTQNNSHLILLWAFASKPFPVSWIIINLPGWELLLLLFFCFIFNVHVHLKCFHFKSAEILTFTMSKSHHTKWSFELELWLAWYVIAIVDNLWPLFRHQRSCFALFLLF